MGEILIFFFKEVGFFSLFRQRASLVAQTVKRLPTMRETWVQSLSWEDPLEREMATHSSTLAWKIPWTRLSSFTHYNRHAASRLK